MSTTNQTQTDVRTELLFSHRVQTDRRSFFFHVKRAPEGPPYLTLSQYARLGDEWVRLKLVVPSEDAKAFYQGLCEALKALRASSEGEAEAPMSSAEPQSRPARKPAQARADSLTRNLSVSGER